MDETKVVRVPLRVANSYLVIGRKTVIVDTGDPGYSKQIIKAMRANGIKNSDISMIFLTHGHIDHFGSVYELKRQVDAPVVIQKIDEKYLLEGTQAPLYPQNSPARFLKAIGKDKLVKKRYDLKADIIFDDDMDLTDYGLPARVVATPGHTLGSASLVLNNDKALVGDLLVHKYFLFGEPCPPPFMHDYAKHKESMKKLLEMGVESFFPGHGPVIQKHELALRSVN